MPKQLIHDASVPSFVLERLQLWARAIRVQRVTQGLTADALGMRIGISRSTMRRLERGEPAIAAHVYLSAMWVVGLLDTACPTLPEHLQRAAHPAPESQLVKIRVSKPSRSPDDF